MHNPANPSCPRNADPRNESCACDMPERCPAHQAIVEALGSDPLTSECARWLATVTKNEPAVLHEPLFDPGEGLTDEGEPEDEYEQWALLRRVDAPMPASGYRLYCNISGDIAVVYARHTSRGWCWTRLDLALPHLLYPPTVWSTNTERARASGEPECIPYECYVNAVRNNKVGDVVRAWAGAPGVGHITHRITRIDETGVYAIEIENTISVPDDDYYC